jgi:hypothetical protein
LTWITSTLTIVFFNLTECTTSSAPFVNYKNGVAVANACLHEWFDSVDLPSLPAFDPFCNQSASKSSFEPARQAAYNDFTNYNPEATAPSVFFPHMDGDGAGGVAGEGLEYNNLDNFHTPCGEY